MARFVFELESVLEQRRRDEERCMLDLAGFMRERASVEARIAEIQAKMGEDRAEWRAHLGARASSDIDASGPDDQRRSIDLRSVRLQAHASLRDEMEMRRASLDLAAALRREGDARGRLLHAARARKAVEMLRERRLVLWKQEQRRKEHVESDEIATMRGNRPAFGGIMR